MNIAFILRSFPELSETFILNQITGLLARGHEVDIFALRRNSSTELHTDFEGYSLADRTYYSSSMPKGRAGRVVKGLALCAGNFHRNPMKILRSINIINHGGRAPSITPLYFTIPFLDRGKYRYDIIQCHFGPIANWAVALRKLGVIDGKIVTMFHGIDIREGIRSGGDIYESLKKEGDCFLSISSYNRSHLLSFGFPEERIVHHPVGVDTSFFRSDGKGKSSTDREIRILSVARLVEEKGLDHGILALKKLVELLPNRRISYRILGGGVLEKELRAYAAGLGLSRKVSFLGEGNGIRVMEEMQKADIYFLPSNDEALPVSIMEAASVGLPVVASDVGSVSELVQNGTTGIIVKKGDADGFAEQLKYLVQNPGVRSRMGTAGRAHIQANYDIENLNDRLVAIYSRLLQQSDPARHESVI